jgi:hypothetical protein
MTLLENEVADFGGEEDGRARERVDGGLELDGGESVAKRLDETWGIDDGLKSIERVLAGRLRLVRRGVFLH